MIPAATTLATFSVAVQQYSQAQMFASKGWSI
jgi:hypothetical protein